MKKIEKLIVKYQQRANTLTAIPADEILRDLEDLKKDTQIQWRMPYPEPLSLEKVKELNDLKLY